MIAIQTAAPLDLCDIQTCAHASYRRYIAAIGQAPAPMVADFAAQIAAGQVWSAKTDDGILQGFIVFYPQDDAMLLENVAVHPNAAGEGLGTRLIRFCEDQARAQGLIKVCLYTNEKMTENLQIYPHLGYCESGRRREDGFARVYFEKQL